MKKILALTLIILFSLPLLSGCGGNNEPPAIAYSSEILINQETLPQDFTWYINLWAPSSGRGVLPLPSYTTYATLNSDEILKTARRDCRDILDAKAPFQDTFFEKVAFFFSRKFEDQKHNYKLKVLGMTSEEYEQKIKKYIDLNDFHYYDDRVIGIIYPVIYQGETEETVDSEYANKTLLVDYDYKTSVVIAYTDEEMIAENGGLYSTSYIGRIGDRFYLPYGYYDLAVRKLCPYTNENDLPPFEAILGIEDPFNLGRLIKNDPDVAPYIPDGCYVNSYALVGDRYYAVMSEMNRFYGNSIDDYEGENVFLVMMDATTGEVLYLQKFHIENYWGYEYKLFSMGEDGILYDVMMP